MLGQRHAVTQQTQVERLCMGPRSLPSTLPCYGNAHHLILSQVREGSVSNSGSHGHRPTLGAAGRPEGRFWAAKNQLSEVDLGSPRLSGLQDLAVSRKTCFHKPFRFPQMTLDECWPEKGQLPRKVRD